MARVVDHLSVGELEGRHEACRDVTPSRDFQTIHLLAKGHSTREVADITLSGRRWIEQLVERYNAFGPAAVGDRRRANRGVATVPSRSCWSGLAGVCANRRPTAEFGRAARPRRGWRANWAGKGLRRNAAGRRCGRSAGVDPEAAAAQSQGGDAGRAGRFQKTSPMWSPRKRRATPARRSRPSPPASIVSA